MSKKLGKQIAKGTLDSRLKERNLKRTIKKIQKSERKLLKEVKFLLESNRQEEAVLVCKNLLDSRKSIQKLGRLQYFVRSIQSYYRKAQIALLSGETMEEISASLTAVSRFVSIDSVNDSITSMETNLDELSINLDQINEILEDYTDPLLDEDNFVNNIINKLENAKPEEIDVKISEIIATDNLLPKIPEEIIEQQDYSPIKN